MDGLREGSRLSIGSLPHLDAREAVQFQLRAFPEMPAWPQLPRKSPKEKMTFQGLTGLPGISWLNPDQAVWTIPPTDLVEVMEVLKSENQANRLDRGAFQPEEASGFFSFLEDRHQPLMRGAMAVKGQCAGPITLGLLFQDENGKPLLANREAMNVLREYLLIHARWQVQRLRSLRKPVVFFIDEPSVGSAFNPESFGLKWEDLQGWLRGLIEPLQEEGVLVGLHCCGGGPWDWIFETPVEFFHFDGFRYLNQLLNKPKPFNEFIQKGGMVVWGMVPTAMARGSFSDPAELFNQWVDGFDALVKKGIPREALIGRSFFSTSCGLGNSSVSLAEEAARCLNSVVSLWRANISLK
jgi:hypothetical protein